SERTPEEVNKDNIDELSMSEIERGKDAELSELKDGEKDILNAAFNDLKEGGIDRQTYLNLFNGLKKFGEDVKNEHGNLEISQTLYNYLNDESDDVYDTTGKMTKHGITVGTILKAHDLHKKGFRIKKSKTKGKKAIRNRVRNPEVGGINKSKNRSTKLYYKRHMDIEIKRGNGKKIPIADKVNWKEGAKGGLKTKAGWLGVALDAGLNVKDNIQDGESTQRIIGDAGVDVGIGAVSLAAAGAASAAVVGTAGLPLLAGAAVGIGTSYAISAVAGIEVGGKSLTNHAKDFVQDTTNAVKSGMKTVAGWFK